MRNSGSGEKDTYFSLPLADTIPDKPSHCAMRDTPARVCPSNFVEDAWADRCICSNPCRYQIPL